MIKGLRVATGLAAAMLAMPAVAGEGADLLREHLYAGTIDAGLQALAPLAEGGDQEVLFAVGVLTFFDGMEGLAQALYRHGLAGPETGPMGPDMALPMPVNPGPEALDYPKVRAIVTAFVETMDEAQAVLLRAGESGDYVVDLDPLLFRIDVNGDGVGDASESVGGIFGTTFGSPTGDLEPTPAPEGKTKGDKINPPAKPDTTLGLDRADAIWLAGYTQVFAGWGDFLLAHDFSDFVNAVFHRFFPAADLPMQPYSNGGALMFDAETDNAIADLIAGVHTLNWPVTEPDRLKRVLERMRTITRLSRENWKAILAETDDHREWIPSPRQSPLLPDAVVTDEIVAAWHDTLDKVDLVLAGELLIPHWRFKQGFDLKAYFETATRTDLVMIISGFGALPFLKDGLLADLRDFEMANAVFGDAFPGYAIWFN